MKKINRNFWPVSGYLFAIIGIMLLMTVFTAFVDSRVKLLLIHVTLTLFAGCALVLISDRLRSDMSKFLARLVHQLTPSQKSVLGSVPTPVAVFGYRGEIIWYNSEFHTRVLNGGDMLGSNVSRIEKKFDMDAVRNGRVFYTRIAKRWYNCAAAPCGGDDRGKFIVYFYDVTELKIVEQKYADSRPTVMIVVFDNEDELFKARESERLRVISDVEALINCWVGGTTGGICWANARDKSLIILEEKQAKALIDDRFSVLERAKSIVSEDGTPVTLSIGVGRGGKDLNECETWAMQALDMALGRGGDQAAIRSPEGYSFFGGVSNSSERQSKVRIRMSAVALSELAEKSDNCIIMGHRYSDLDSIGAAIGVYGIVHPIVKETLIAVDTASSLAGGLINQYTKSAGAKCFIDVVSVLDHVRENTLLIIVDTHSPKFVESRALYERAKHVVVIDHHRMMVDHISNAELFIQEPYASSACEIVSEIASYIAENNIGHAEAGALLSGIMLDTKNFVLRTGVRTFEAAAFLRKRGADTVEVKRLFSESLDTYVEKSRLVSSAVVYKGCAISHTTERIPNIRIVSSQAADDMLTIKDVNASFVLFDDDGQINISARSLGKVNVQLVMEKLGGGGHLTMAGAQIKDTPMLDALEELHEAIDELRG